jgi:uncharacterized ubiquitin-like protein YukD
MMHYGACMINLTRLPPSKHVLWLSTPLISKIKKIISELWESSSINLEKFLNHKNKCKSKIFSDYIYIGLTGIACLHWLRANFPGLIMGA